MTLNDFYQFIRTHRDDLLEEQRERLHCDAFSPLACTIEDAFNTLLAWFVDRRYPNRVASLTDETVRKRFVTRLKARLSWIDEGYRPQRKYSPRTRKACITTDGPTITCADLDAWYRDEYERLVQKFPPMTATR